MRLIRFALVLVAFFCTAKVQAAFPANSPAAVNGRLSVCGTNLCNESGSPIQLRGMSSHGLNWDGGINEYINSSSISWIASDWGADIIRGAMYTVEYAGYVSGTGVDKVANQTALEKRLDDMVNAAEAAGIYAIVDWHILNDNNPQTYQTEAIAFFQKMAAKYAGKTHVLYEICNEPNGSTTWSQIRPYAVEVTKAIRDIDKKGIVIVGTPNWSQDVDIASATPILDTEVGGNGTGKAENLMYTLHFYSATHKQSFRDKAQTAINNGLPLFVTEWGTSPSSGDGTIDTAEATTWLNFLRTNKISWCNWSLSAKGETSAALVSGASFTGNWTSSNLTASGKYVRANTLSPADDFPAGAGPFTLTTSATGGTVAASPATSPYAKGTLVTLTATSATNYVFTGWSGDASGTTNPTTVTMNGNKTVQALFKYNGPMTLTVSPSSNGTVAVSPVKTTYTAGEQVVLTATPATGYLFAGWSGNGSGSVNPLSLKMDSNITIGANFITLSGGTNLVTNGDFGNGTTGWSLGLNGNGAAGTGSVVNGEYKVGITNGGVNTWDVQFSQAPISLVKGKSYELLFYARADAARTINPNVGMNGGTYPSYSNWTPLSVTTSNTLYRLTFKMDSASDTKARLEFNAGANASPLYLDNIILRELATNQLPVASNLTASTAQGTAVAVTLSATDADGTISSYAVSTAPKHGTTTVSGATLTYTPAAGYYGDDTLFYTATDNGSAVSAAAKVVVTVTHVNHAPVVALALVDLSVNEDAVVSSISLVGTFSDADGDALTLSVSNKQSSLATVSVTGTSLSIVLRANASGKDTVLVKAVDGSGASVTDTFVVNVASVNDVPVVRDTAVTTSQETAKVVTLSATDVDGAITSYAVFAAPKHGTATVSGNALTYTPAVGFFGNDTLLYTATDNGSAVSAAAKVVVTVTHVNHAPVVALALVDLSVNEDAVVSSISLVGTFSDADGEALTLSVSNKQSSLATVSVTGTSLSIVLKANASGKDTVLVKAVDASGASVTDTFVVNVASVNDVPVVRDTAVTTQQEMAKVVTLSATDVDGTIASYAVSTAPKHGTAVLGGGALIYTPITGFFGNDTLFYTATDNGSAVSAAAKVVVTVTHVNHAPVVALALVDLSVNEDAVVSSISLVGTFSDADGEALTLSVSNKQSSLATVSVTGTSLSIVLKANASGKDTVLVKAVDASGVSVTDTFFVNVASVNDAPVVRDTAVTTQQEMAKSVVLAATDADGTISSYAVSTAPKHGTATVSGNALTYTPAVGYYGDDTLFYTATDNGSAVSAAAKVVVTVTHVNHAPVVAVALSDLSVNEDAVVASISLVGTFSDVDGEALTLSVSNKQSSLATVSVTGTSLSIVLKANASGKDTVLVKAVDASGASVTDTFFVNVASVNDVPVVRDTAVTTQQEMAKVVTLSATDTDGAIASYAVSTAPKYGTATVSGNTLTYTPATGFWGNDTLLYTATDNGSAVSAAAKIVVTVTRTNVGPVGIEPISRKVLVSHDLGAVVPRLFAKKVAGAGRGELGLAASADPENSLALDIQLPAPGRVEVSIFDQIGTPVIAYDCVVDGAELASLSRSEDGRRILPLTWNLRSSDGQAVGSGVYLWKIKVLTLGGQLLETVHRMGVK